MTGRTPFSPVFLCPLVLQVKITLTRWGRSRASPRTPPALANPAARGVGKGTGPWDPTPGKAQPPPHECLTALHTRLQPRSGSKAKTTFVQNTNISRASDQPVCHHGTGSRPPWSGPRPPWLWHAATMVRPATDALREDCQLVAFKISRLQYLELAGSLSMGGRAPDTGLRPSGTALPSRGPSFMNNHLAPDGVGVRRSPRTPLVLALPAGSPRGGKGTGLCDPIPGKSEPPTLVRRAFLSTKLPRKHNKSIVSGQLLTIHLTRGTGRSHPGLKVCQFAQKRIHPV